MIKSINVIFMTVAVIIAQFANVFAAEGGSSRSISEVRDFSEIAREIGDKRLPLVLMFSADHCGYCVQLENDFLIPMQISGDYVDRALIRKMDIGYGNTVRDFNGERMDASDFAQRYNVSVTPTVVFLDAMGNQLAVKQVGLTTPDFYGGFLDESIATALDILRRNKPLRAGVAATR